MPDWKNQTRFFLPNEDASLPVKAMAALSHAPAKSIFITGSGMLAIEALTHLPDDAEIECWDLSSFQNELFKELTSAINASRHYEEMHTWLNSFIIPQLTEYYKKRGDRYNKDGIWNALQNYFKINFLFEREGFKRAKDCLPRIKSFTGDVKTRLKDKNRYDFVHLSNIPDYISLNALKEILDSCRKHDASVFCIATTACKDLDNIEKCAEMTGYQLHPLTSGLQKMNQGLGANQPIKKWMRKGHVFFFVPNHNFNASK